MLVMLVILQILVLLVIAVLSVAGLVFASLLTLLILCCSGDDCGHVNVAGVQKVKWMWNSECCGGCMTAVLLTFYFEQCN